MESKPKFLIIGYGNMGRAMINPLEDKFDITVVTPNSTPTIKSTLHRSLNDLTGVYDYIMFAVKPYQIQDVLPLLKASNYNLEKTIFISILVGIEIGYFKKTLGQEAKVARVMPSLPVSVNEGIMLVLNDGIHDLKFDYFEPLGKVIYLNSVSDFEKMTSICCCAPGYIYHLFEQYQIASENMEVESEIDLKEIVYQIFKGTLAHFEQNRNSSFTELKGRVTSKNGTTAAGIEKMQDINVNLLEFQNFFS